MHTHLHLFSIPGLASRLETCFPVMLGTWWFMTFVLLKTMSETSTAILCKCWPLSFFSLAPGFCASYFYLFLPLYFLWTDFEQYRFHYHYNFLHTFLFILLPIDLLLYIHHIIPIPDWLVSHTSLTNLLHIFLYSLDLSYLWPPFLFDNWGYDNPIYSPKFQHPF